MLNIQGKSQLREYESRGSYYYLPGSHYKDESYEGSSVVGRWVKDNFQPVNIFWWTPKHSITRDYIAQLENGKFAVRRKGMNDAWIGRNSFDIVLDRFEHASDELELRVNLANRVSLKRAIWGLIGEALILSIVITWVVLSYKYG